MLFFFFNDTATTEIYTLSLHDALPIWVTCLGLSVDVSYAVSGSEDNTVRLWKPVTGECVRVFEGHETAITRVCISLDADRKSTRLNSSHQIISYAVFCLKKKK